MAAINENGFRNAEPKTGSAGDHISIQGMPDLMPMPPNPTPTAAKKIDRDTYFILPSGDAIELIYVVTRGGIPKALSATDAYNAATWEAEALQAQSPPVEAVAEYVRGYKDGFDGAEDALGQLAAEVINKFVTQRINAYAKWDRGGDMYDQGRGDAFDLAEQMLNSAFPVAQPDRGGEGKVEGVREKLTQGYNDAGERFVKEQNDYLDGRRIALFEAISLLNSAFPQVPERGGEGGNAKD